MKCVYCLEEIVEGAAACPHCTREQPWAIQARHKRIVGCIATIIAVVVGGFFLLMIIGSRMQQSDERKRVALDDLNRFNAACWIFVQAGDFSSDDECRRRADVDQLETISLQLEQTCNQAKSAADEAVNHCERKYLEVRKCKKFTKAADTAADIARCKIEARKREREQGITLPQPAKTSHPG